MRRLCQLQITLELAVEKAMDLGAYFLLFSMKAFLSFYFSF